jgi:aminoglycoside phosphotransferase
MSKWDDYEQDLQTTQSVLAKLKPSLSLRHQNVWRTRADVEKQVQKLKSDQDSLSITKQKLKSKLADLRKENEEIAWGAIATVVGMGILGLMSTKKRK